MPPMGCPADIFLATTFFAPFKYIASKKFDISKLYNKFYLHAIAAN